MKVRVLSLVSVMACFVMVASAFAQSGADPVSGTWTGTWGPSPADRNDVTVNLKWDGKALIGSVNPGPNQIALTKTMFDPKTGAVHMEADAPAPGGGRLIHYLIDGKVDKGAMTGTWNHDSRKGDFKITKK